MASEYPSGPADVALPPAGAFGAELRNLGRMLELPKNYQLADTFYEELEEQIKERETALEPEEELQLIYKDRGGEIITVTGIGYHNPFMILFSGKDNLRNEVTVLTHMANVELLVKTVPSADPENRRPIGFQGSSAA